MKTAEEILKKHTGHAHGLMGATQISAMKEYAIAVSIEVLQAAISNLDDSMSDFGGLNDQHKSTILSTIIITP